jgi:hypothetical protein
MQDALLMTNKRVLEELRQGTEIYYYLNCGDGCEADWIRGIMGQIRTVYGDLWGNASFDLPFGVLRVKMSKSFNPTRDKLLGGWSFADESKNSAFAQPAPEAKSSPPKKRSRKQTSGREASAASPTMDDAVPPASLSFFARRADPRSAIVLLSCDVAKDVELLKEQLRDRRACAELFQTAWQKR